MNLTLNKQKIALPNGETLAYLEENPKGKETVLLVHGNFSSSAHWLRMIENLKGKYHVLAPDLRGFGDSTYHQRIKSFKELADDLALFLKEKKVDQAHVFGWSLGGGVAMELAANHPAVVKKVVLIASTTHKGYPVFKKDAEGNQLVGECYASPEEMATDPVQVAPLLGIITTKNVDFMKQALSALAVKPLPDAELTLYASESVKQANLIDADWAISTLNMSHEDSHYSKGTDTIKNIKCPVLHLWGSKDIWLAPEYMTLDNYNAIRDNSKLIYYYDCGHMVFYDKSEESFNDIINFLNS
ncbi:MAG: alpha/beta fold hydrolase [Acholeplasmataceae bacterium]|jgi:pimeloyl-ACP methyl ester carboxylesterase